MFNNAVVLHDQYVTSGEWEFLNTKYVYPVFNQRDSFEVSPFMMPSNQRILSAYIWVSMNMKWLNPRMHSRITTISNA